MLDGLEDVVAQVGRYLAALDEAREKAYRLSREVVRVAATTIRHIHRSDYKAAREALNETAAILREMLAAVADHPLLRYSGFVTDAEKEYCEAAIFVAAVSGEPAPSPDALGVDCIAWLNGLCEVVGELRRHVLDLIRQGDPAGGEEFLQLMEDIYHHTMVFDYPNAITSGLRSRTDQARGAIERTRGELTMAIQSHQLAQRVENLRRRLDEAP
ncbi:MAG: haloacid dehalogenase [Armatimonadetes bacterium]|nr:haloacid dehalogenase [Armatimonadota bacterium]